MRGGVISVGDDASAGIGEGGGRTGEIVLDDGGLRYAVRGARVGDLPTNACRDVVAPGFGAWSVAHSGALSDAVADREGRQCAARGRDGIVAIFHDRRGVRIGFLREAVEGVVSISGGDGGRAGLIRCGSGFCGEVSVRVVDIGGWHNREGAYRLSICFRIGGAREPRERVVDKGAGAPLSGVCGATFLIHSEQIVKCIVSVVGFVIEARRIFPHCGKATECVSLVFSSFARWVCDRRCRAGIGGYG